MTIALSRDVRFQYVATGLTLQLWRLWLGTASLAFYLAILACPFWFNPMHPTLGWLTLYALILVVYLFLGSVLLAVALDIVSCLFCCATPHTWLRLTMLATPVMNLAGLGFAISRLGLYPSDPLHRGMLAFGMVSLLGIGATLFLHFLKATAKDVGSLDMVSYVSRTRRLWHVVTPLILSAIGLATFDAIAFGIFRLYVILLWIPTLALLAWFWIRYARTLTRVRAAVRARAEAARTSLATAI